MGWEIDSNLNQLIDELLAIEEVLSFKSDSSIS